MGREHYVFIISDVTAVIGFELQILSLVLLRLYPPATARAMYLRIEHSHHRLCDSFMAR